jgi:PKD repeat protein
VTVTPPSLHAAFYATPLWGARPLTVTFTDDSSGPPIEKWAWDFGDGVTSTLQHPTHIYIQSGIYSVTLNIMTSADADFLTKADYVRVVDRMYFTYLPLIIK